MPKSLNRNKLCCLLLMAMTQLFAIGACSSEPPAATTSRGLVADSTLAETLPAASDDFSESDETEYPMCRRVFEQFDSLPSEAWEGTLRELVDDLNQRTKVRVKIDGQGLKDEGLSQDLLITVKRHGSLLIGLRVALRAAKLDVIVRDGDLIITSGARAANTQYRGTLSLMPLLKGETSLESALRQLQMAEPESIWQQVHGDGGVAILHPTEKRVEVIQTAWVLWQLEKWLNSHSEKLR